MNKRIPANAILITAQKDDALVFIPADTLVGGITMAFNSNTPAAQKNDHFAPRIVYLNTGKNTLPVDQEFKEYIQTAKDYLLAHPDKKLLVTGYTDNVGSASINIALPESSANFIRNELVKQGIPANSMQSSAQGMNNPVGDNGTPDGRSKNRRVTIQLQ